MLTLFSSAQSHDLKTSLAGQIARALAVFCVDEVIVFDDGQGSSQNGYRQKGTDDEGYTGHSNPNHFLAHLLTYLETPPHLRKHLFPLHQNLRTAGTLPSLDMPHHLRANEWCEYREGVTVPAPNPNPNAQPAPEKKRKGKGKGKTEPDEVDVTAHADVGLSAPVILETPIPPGTRVTVQFADKDAPHQDDHKRLNAQAVAPSTPREGDGYYWGYNVRAASSLSEVLTESPFEGGYDVTIGTSERGKSLAELQSLKGFGEMMGGYEHLLLCFGGVAGLEVAVRADEELKSMGVMTPEKLFDQWVNLCPGQGSRTIRTEEAVWLGLMGLSSYVSRRNL